MHKLSKIVLNNFVNMYPLQHDMKLTQLFKQKRSKIGRIGLTHLNKCTANKTGAFANQLFVLRQAYIQRTLFLLSKKQSANIVKKRRLQAKIQ